MKKFKLVKYHEAYGVDKEECSKCDEDDIFMDLANVILQEFFPGHETKLEPIKWGDCKAAWLLDNGYVIALKEEDCVKKEKMYTKQALNVKLASFDPDAYFALFDAADSNGNIYIALLIPWAFVEGNNFDEIVNYLNKKNEDF